jgi:pimeloyl-ACP methyl ester carboxylesterase
MAHKTNAAFNRSTLLSIDRASHLPGFDQPKECNRDLRDFLRFKWGRFEQTHASKLGCG